MNKVMLVLIFSIGFMANKALSDCDYRGTSIKVFKTVSILDQSWYLLDDPNHPKDGYTRIYVCKPTVNLNDPESINTIFTITADNYAWVPAGLWVLPTTQVVFK